nr:hypothetical protein [Acinetobacter schindleri]
MMLTQKEKIQKFLVIFLCFWVAFFEGFDLQAPGIAAKGIAETFALDQVQMAMYLVSAFLVCYSALSLVGVSRTI